MIVKEVSGNLINALTNGDVQVLVHGCNCFCTMGAGIAKMIKKEYYGAYSADLGTQKGDKNKLGFFSSWHQGDRSIINLYTQYYYGKAKGDGPLVDYDAIDRGFSLINDRYKGTGKIIGIPKIGAGLARGDWSKIESIINEVTPDIEIHLYMLIGNGK